MLNKEKTITISLDEYNRLLESQKQVDELKKSQANKYALEAIYNNGYEQAVKDTAKEIYDYIKSIEEHGLPTSCVGEWVKNRLKERYGVEVE